MTGQPYVTKPISFYRPDADRAGTDVDGTETVFDPKTGEYKTVRHPSMTKQAFAEACDINNILREYSVTGMVSHLAPNAAEGRYEDMPESVDYQEAMNVVLAAQETFATLPSKLRERFENDPAQFLEFVNDPANRAEAKELGLLKPEQSPEPQGAPAGGSEATGGSGAS